MKSKYLKILVCSCLLLLQFFGGAYASDISLGQVSRNVMLPAIMLTQMAYVMCYVIGTALIISSLIRYKEYRNNPVHVRLTQPVLFLIFGIIMIFLPIVTQLSKSAPTYTLLYQMGSQ